MKYQNLKSISQRSFGILLLALLTTLALAQTPSLSRGVIRLRVRVGAGEGPKAKGLSRKRFYLIKGSMEENKAFLQSLEQQQFVSRDCYYRSIGGSDALINWLKQSGCESIYCREVEAADIEGPAAVPEFQRAVDAGEKQFGNRELARKWLAVNLPDNIKNGFYKRQQEELQAFLKKAEELTKNKVMSVMTDQNGTAYFTEVEPGTYVITNVLPAEVGSSSELWTCQVKIAPGDLASATRERPFLIVNPSNKDPRDKNPKCVSIEKPLPTCPTQNRAAN